MSAQSTNYLLIGGGVASLAAAQAIRERDAEGAILIVCGENHPPYDRPPLSKKALTKNEFADDDAYSKFDHFYPDNKIDLLVGERVVKLDRAAKVATLENGGTIAYDKALIATGSSPRGCDMPGCELPGVFFLRTIEDAKHLREALHKHPNVAIVGAGYLGMEVAAACLSRGLSTTVIAPGEHPWPLFASDTLGHFIKHRFEAEGVRFVLEHDVIGVAGTSRAEAVVTSAGTTPAECVIVCVGSTLNSDVAKASGLEIASEGGVVANAHLQTNDPHVWTAGDVAHFEDVALGTHWHAEHIIHARWQGTAAGANMAGADAPYNKVAYFFSDFLDLHMILRGDPNAGQQSAFFGSVKDGEFVELTFDGEGRVRMGIAISRDEPKLDPISDTLEVIIRAGENVRDIRADRFGL